MINQFSPLADTHLLVWISFYILMTHRIFVEIELSVKRGLLLIAFPEVEELGIESFSRFFALIGLMAIMKMIPILGMVYYNRVIF